MPDDEPCPQGSATALPIGESARAYVAALLDSRRTGYALPGAFFRDERVFAADMELIFARHWLFLASEAEIPEGGDYRTYQIGHYPIFVLRRDDGSIAAFHNTCRHRGSRILQQDSGVAGATLMCPYHRWSYDLEGQVVGCGATGELPRAQPPLKPVHVKLLAGLIFVCMSDAPPPDFDDMAQRMAPYLAPHALRTPRWPGRSTSSSTATGSSRSRTTASVFTVPATRNCCAHCSISLGKSMSHGCPRTSRPTIAATLAPAPNPKRCGNASALPWQPIEELHGRTTGFRTERLVLDGAGRIHDARYQGSLAPAAR